MDSSVFSSSKKKIPEFFDFILPEKSDIFRQRLSVFANITQNPEHMQINVALTKRNKCMIRDSSFNFLNGSKVHTSLLCSKYAKNFGIMADMTVFPPANREIQHNLQLEMSTTGPLLRYTFTMNKDLSDVLKNLSAQFSASGSYGLAAPSASFGAHLWTPLPFTEKIQSLQSFRSHAFLNFGSAPHSLFGRAGVGISTQIGERGRIDLNYCLVTGLQLGLGFDYGE